MHQAKINDKFKPVDISQVQLLGLLGKHVSMVPQRLMEGQSEEYIKVLEEPNETGLWNAEHPGKWLEAACNTWKYTHDPKLRKMMDDFAQRLVKAQQPDGWLGSYVPEVRFHNVDWNNLQLTAGEFPGKNGENYFFDLWCNFLTMLGLIRYYEASNDKKFLDAACKIGDLIAATFGDGKQDVMAINWDWGQNPAAVMYGMARLYGMTGKPAYLEFCKYIIRRYGEKDTPPIFITDIRSSKYPFDNWSHILKHCEFEINLMGLCELYRQTGETADIVTCQNIYDGYYVPQVETLCLHGFKAPPPGIRIPNTYYSCLEICDIPIILRWFLELAQLTGEAQYLDAVEWNLYNTFLSRSLTDGGVVPFTGDVKEALGVSSCNVTNDIRHCCYSMLAVGISYIPSWCYLSTPNGILVNLYETSILSTEISGKAVRMEQITRYPLDGIIELTIEVEKPLFFDLYLRIPGWCTSGKIMINDQFHDDIVPSTGSLLCINREWRKNDQVTVSLDMPIRVVQREYADSVGKSSFTIERGPFIFALPEKFNPNIQLDTVKLLIESDGSLKADVLDHTNQVDFQSNIFKAAAYVMEKDARNEEYKKVSIFFIPFIEVEFDKKYRVEFDNINQV